MNNQQLTDDIRSLLMPLVLAGRLNPTEATRLQTAIAELVTKHTALKSAEHVEDQDDGVDPTSTDLMKPRGNGGVVSADICYDALLLVGDVCAPPLLVESWTQEQRDRAYDWAMRRYLHTSDNDDVYVPPWPDFVMRAR